MHLKKVYRILADNEKAQVVFLPVGTDKGAMCKRQLCRTTSMYGTDIHSKAHFMFAFYATALSLIGGPPLLQAVKCWALAGLPTKVSNKLASRVRRTQLVLRETE